MCKFCDAYGLTNGGVDLNSPEFGQAIGALIASVMDVKPTPEEIESARQVAVAQYDFRKLTGYEFSPDQSDWVQRADTNEAVLTFTGAELAELTKTIAAQFEDVHGHVRNPLHSSELKALLNEVRVANGLPPRS